MLGSSVRKPAWSGKCATWAPVPSTVPSDLGGPGSGSSRDGGSNRHTPRGRFRPPPAVQSGGGHRLQPGGGPAASPRPRPNVKQEHELPTLMTCELIPQRPVEVDRDLVVRSDAEPDLCSAPGPGRLMERLHDQAADATMAVFRVDGDAEARHGVALAPAAQHPVAHDHAVVDGDVIL